MIALALALRPKLLFLDEPTTALDVVVQRSILQMLNDLRRELGFGVVFITHDLSLLVEIADKIAIMYAGEIVEEAPAQSLYENPEHPYTAALMHAFPPVGAQRKRLEGLAGQPPDLRQLPQGCPFAPRCPKMIAGTCDVVAPPEVSTHEGRRVLCHLYGDVVVPVGMARGGTDGLGAALAAPAAPARGEGASDGFEGGSGGKVATGG